MQSTLNVRMDRSVKERGDKVLREYGIGTSDAVRAFWEYLGTAKELPQFLQTEVNGDDEMERKKMALLQLVGIGEGKYSNLSDEEMREEYMKRYEAAES